MGGIISRPSEWIEVKDNCRDVGHTWSSSCVLSTLDLWIKVFIEAVKIYFPLYFIGDLIKGRSLRYLLRYTLFYALRSSLFLSVNGAFFVTFICIIRRLLGRFYFLSVGYLPGLCASFCAILIERKSRRGALTTYVATIGLECLYRILKHRGYVQPLPFGEVIIFCLGSAVLLHNYKSKASVRSGIDSLLGLLFNPLLPQKLKGVLSGKSAGLIHNVAMFTMGTALVSLWSFGIGYTIQTLLNALQLGSRIIRKPARIKQALTKPYNRHFGVFLATFTAIFKVLNTLLFLLSVPRDSRLRISGLFAGLSMLFIRSNSLSFYAFMKALEVLYFKGVSKGWCHSYYYGDVIIYSLCTAILFHTAMLESHNIRLSYWRFIDLVTKKRIRDINYDVMDIFQTDSSQLLRIITAQEQMERKKQESQQQQRIAN